MRVRRAVAADVERIAEVHVLTWKGAYQGLLPQPLLDRFQPAQRVPQWERIIERTAWPRQGTLVAEDEGDLIGFADLCPTRDDDRDPAKVGELAAIYVLPAAWKRGAGRGLMTEAMRTLREAGYSSATLWVLEGNDRAIRFYERMGWRPDGTVKDAVIGGREVRELRYRCELS
ncbi:GNAT family N-acetyltransferase [Nonomuraea fastidiosa]|jgi:GNAT superfamily N-acetyltransferase|uniref:GNAT family N-acetyltransferase n=1 Tax=Nonomuraea TaxID=83681 RepID=UPI0032548CED